MGRRSILTCVALAVSAIAVPDAGAAPRSDARVLHVDFENYVDGVVQALNAGVRWLGDPFSGRDEGVVEVTTDFGFAGSRAGHVHSESLDQIARIRLQHRFDAPTIVDDEVIELVFRATQAEPVDLEGFLVCSIRSKAGKPVGFDLKAIGTADAGTYTLIAEFKGDGLESAVVLLSYQD